MKSTSCKGVEFEIARVSLSGRVEITTKVGALLRELEYRNAGDEVQDRLEAARLDAAIDRAYVDWGLRGIRGLSIDGEVATAANLLERGPEALSREIAAAIRRECSLSEAERKN
jgi:hypothetical protein